ARRRSCIRGSDMRASPVRMENLVGQALGLRRPPRPPIPSANRPAWTPAAGLESCPRTDMRAFPTRTALTIATFALILAAVSRVLHGVEALSLPAAAAIVEFTPELTPLRPWQPHTAPEAIGPPPRLLAGRTAIRPTLDDRHGALDHFYAALWRTERGAPLAI